MNCQQQWIPKGFLYQPDRNLWWSRSHAMLPTPWKISADTYRIFFSGRDSMNRSHVGSFDVVTDPEPRVIASATEPVLAPGRLGTFDDNGVSPSCVVETEAGDILLFYIGWNPGSTTRMNLFGGLAVSSDGQSFSRVSEAPLLERNAAEPFINTAPWVVEMNGHWMMYYVSGVGWDSKDKPFYNIHLAISDKPTHWQRDGRIAIDFENPAEHALARPCVYSHQEGWRMLFSTKGDAYQMQSASSFDGIRWERDHKDLELLPTAEDEVGSNMVEYGVIVENASRRFLLYNGDNYGERGVGIAVEPDCA